MLSVLRTVVLKNVLYFDDKICIFGELDLYLHTTGLAPLMLSRWELMLRSMTAHNTSLEAQVNVINGGTVLAGSRRHFVMPCPAENDWKYKEIFEENVLVCMV